MKIPLLRSGAISNHHSFNSFYNNRKDHQLGTGSTEFLPENDWIDGSFQSAPCFIMKTYDDGSGGKTL